MIIRGHFGYRTHPIFLPATLYLNPATYDNARFRRRHWAIIRGKFAQYSLIYETECAEATEYSKGRPSGWGIVA